MTRLKHILLTGTIVPALVITPIAGAFAQAPDMERHAPGAPGGGHPEPHGGPGGPGAKGPAERMERPAAAAPRAAAPVERMTPQMHEPPARAEAPARIAPPHAAPAPQRVQAAPDRGVPNPRMDRMSPGHMPEPHRAGAPSAPQHAEPNHAVAPMTPRSAEPNHAAQQPRSAEPNRAAQQPRSAEPNRAAQEPRSTEPNRAVQQPRSAEPNRATEARPTPDRQPSVNTARPGEPAAGRPGQPPQNYGGNYNNQQHDRGISPGGAVAIGAAAGFAGGFLAATGARSLNQIRGDRRESVEDGRTYIREPGRTIVEDGDRSYIVHDENDRFRELGYDVHRERHGADFEDVVNRPDGTQIITYTTPDGRMLRRIRRDRGGNEYVLIDNSYNGGVRSYEQDIVDLPPPPVGIPRDRYIVDYQNADEGLIYDTFAAPPLEAPPARYTLDQIRYSPDVRRYVRSVDINTINFDSGSWIVPGSATRKLEALAGAIKRTISRNPNTVFLVEGYTDATGNPADNLSLSDRRAQSVAAILTKDFNVAPENLTTQGYGQQNLKENTSGASAANRRVVVQNITPLLAAGGQPPR